MKLETMLSCKPSRNMTARCEMVYVYSVKMLDVYSHDNEAHSP